MRLAGLLLAATAIAGCADEGINPTAVPDAPSGGATSASPAPTGLEHIHVFSIPGVPWVDVPVIVTDRVGNVVSIARTDILGNAAFDVPHGAMVSVLVERESACDGRPCVARDIRGVVGFPPDGKADVYVPRDTLEREPEPPAPMKIAVNVPEPPPDAAEVRVTLACGQGEVNVCTLGIHQKGQLEIDDFIGCAGKADYDVYAVAYDSAGEIIAYGSQLDQPFVAGAEVAHDIVVRPGPVVESTVTIEGVPSDDMFVASFMAAVRQGGCTMIGVEYALPPIASNVTRRVQIPASFEDYSVGQYLVLNDGTGSRSWSHGNVWSPSATDSLFVVSGIANVEEAGWLDTGNERLRLSWRLARAGALGDSLVVATSWQRPDARVDWHVTAPPSYEGFVELPKLPPELAGFGYPPAGKGTPKRVTVEHNDSAAVNGYAELFDGVPSPTDVEESRVRRGIETP